MKSVGFIILLVLIFTKAQSAETYGVILSGADSLESNSYRFYSSIQEMYSAFRSAGVKRDNITTLYADGGAKGPDTIKESHKTFHFTREEIDTSVSLEADGQKDIKYPATKDGISSTFDSLAKKLKSGDNLVLYVTDHGDKNDGIILWGGQHYSVGNLQDQLDKLPAGVTVQIATNICYGGQFLRLTRPNVCVVANADDNQGNFSNDNDDPFTIGLAKGLKKPSGKTGPKANMLDAFEVAKENDLPQNKFHLTSIDYFIQKQAESSPKTQARPLCDDRLSPISSLQAEIKDVSDYLSKVNDPRKQYYEKYLKKMLKETTESLDSYENRYSEWVRNRYQKKLDKLKSQWSALSDQEKQNQRSHYTELVEKLKGEDNEQRKKLDDLGENQKRALSELRFLKNASTVQLGQYYSIRKCLEHAL
jgi:hypothetical protein